MQPGDLLYFTPFYFTDSKTQKPKNKYFLVLGLMGTTMVVSSLPTSQDHVPGYMDKVHGCIKSLPGDGFSCYYFQAGQVITTCGWAFPLDTYLYGEQIKTFEISDPRFNTSHQTQPYDRIGCCTSDTYKDIITCLANGTNVSNKYRKLFGGMM